MRDDMTLYLKLDKIFNKEVNMVLGLMYPHLVFYMLSQVKK